MYSAGPNELSVHDLLQERLRVRKQIAGCFAVLRMRQDRGVFSLQLPRGKEVRPVDVLRDFLEKHVVEEPAADERGGRDDMLVPVVSRPICPCLFV